MLVLVSMVYQLESMSSGLQLGRVQVHSMNNLHNIRPFDPLMIIPKRNEVSGLIGFSLKIRVRVTCFDYPEVCLTYAMFGRTCHGTKARTLKSRQDQRVIIICLL